LFPDFGGIARNLRLGLATDGMNPFGKLSTNHNSCPPWLYMKQNYIMLFMMILGPRQPENDIGAYLSPLIEHLKNLWEERVHV